jgi:hypothetical protein
LSAIRKDQAEFPPWSQDGGGTAQQVAQIQSDFETGQAQRFIAADMALAGFKKRRIAEDGMYISKSSTNLIEIAMDTLEALTQTIGRGGGPRPAG